MVWNLYGKKYDLTSLLNIHPGGKNILLLTENEKDITALFESYHSFSNKIVFRHFLSKYEISDSFDNSIKQYDFTNYNLLVERIKLHFPCRESLKPPISFFLQNMFVLFLYSVSFYSAMFSSFSTFNKCFFAFFSGLFYISLGFNIMHDASHYALSISPVFNEYLSKLWNSWGLWNANLWFYHHVVNHHSFTGETKKDPDLYHLRPFANKVTTQKKQLLHEKTFLIPLILTFLPGQYIGQMFSYFLSFFTHKLFSIQLPQKNMFDKYDVFLLSFSLFSLYQGLLLPTFFYFLSMNLWYYINIIFDHDTYETVVINHYEGNDWLQLQVCNSGNFLNGNIVWTRMFGSINYQIEHHLFPNMSNVYYPIIAPIVKQFCEENNIPYVNHGSLFSAYKSYLKMLKYKNS